MKKILFIIGGLTSLCCMAVEAAIAGSALTSLTTAAGANGADLSMVFDGVSPGAAVQFQGAPNNFNSAIEINTPRNIIRNSAFPVPVPVSVFPKDNAAVTEKWLSEGDVLSSGDKIIVDRAIKTLGATLIGKPLADFLIKEGVEIRWKNLASLGKEPNYAQACPPSECREKKVVYLDNSIATHANLFRDVNPTFLAITLAHELTHLSDFKTIGEPKKGTSAYLYLELNGWSNGVYVYHQLANVHIAPAPKADNRDIQLVRLDLAIRNYVNGGGRPVVNDFPELTKVDDLFFNDYVEIVTKVKRIGSMSLAGVVERTYNLPVSLETPVKPASYDYAGLQEYDKYVKFSTSLGLRTADYIHWKEVNNVDAPPPPPPPDDDYDDSGSGGYQDGPGVGGGNGGGHLPDGNPNWDGQ